MRVRARRSVRTVGIVLLAGFALAGCRSKRVLLPPIVELAPHARIGLVTFTSEGTRGALATVATRRFVQQLLAAQPGSEILELGVVAGPMDAAAARRIGEEHGVRSVVVGHVVVSNAKTRASVLGGLRVSIDADVALTARLLSTESGATLWSRSGQLRERIAGVSLVDGEVEFGAQDPDDAYGWLVDRLVYQVTRDFRGTWVRQ
ncbi:MAG: hypothetical protein WD771_06160 [Gemmatimonadaceae bacterium]